MSILCLSPRTYTPNAFISKWKTDNAGTSTSTRITIPTTPGGRYNCQVDWGDGTISNITTYNDPAWTHTYSVASVYTIKILGVFEGIQFNNTGDKLKLLNIAQWGTKFRLGTNETGYFSGCSNLTITATDVLDLSRTTTLAQAFTNCSSITTIPNINSWNVSAITSMANMFSGTSFNQSLDRWNVSACTTFSSMFSGNTAFNSSVDGWTFSSSVTSYNNMFNGATAYNQSMNNWVLPTTGSGYLMNSMFQGAAAFNGHIASWNTSKCTSMASMFRSCPFDQDISAWNTSAVATFSFMFANNTAFNRNIDAWNVSAATNFASMFSGAASYNKSMNSWNLPTTGSGYSMSAMFDAATAFNGDISSWNTIKCTNMSSMFSNSSFNRNIGAWNVTSVTNMSAMFSGNNGFSQNIGAWIPSALTSASNMFLNNTSLGKANYNALLAGWGVSTTASSVPFHGGNNTYDATTGGNNGIAGKLYLTETKLWPIIDGGVS